ncbi:MAG: ParM/StbA family protein [Anaerolineaceae bacterium]|nr:ParM/StbA family protein [Anaerolineaceae bacterium]
MPHYTASVDAGNGGTNAVLATGKTYKRVYFPSVRAVATGDTLGLGSQWEHQFEYVDWNGHRYAVGDSVLTIRRAIEHHTGANRYGNEFHQFLVAKALADLGIKSGEVDLTVFCPPGMYAELNKGITTNFTQQEGKVTIKLKGDKNAREWRYSSVSVWPEGIGAAALFILDDAGNPVQTDLLSGQVLFLDIGAYTTDALLLSDGSFNPETLQHATFEKSGVDEHIRQPILRSLKKRSTDFEILTVDDVDLAIRNGAEGGSYMLHSGAMDMDIAAQVEHQAGRYAEWLANNILDGHYNGLRGIKALVLVGGGAKMVEEPLREWYGDKLLDTSKIPTVKKVHPVDMNAVGGLRLALMRGR